MSIMEIKYLFTFIDLKQAMICRWVEVNLSTQIQDIMTSRNPGSCILKFNQKFAAHKKLRLYLDGAISDGRG